MLVGVLTGTAVFYALMLTDFRGIQELGFIGGSAIFLAWAAMMTVFPAIIILLERRGRARPRPVRAVADDRTRLSVRALERVTLYPRPVLLAAGAMTALAVWGLRGVEFDYNLLDLQAKRTESVLWERKILERASRSGFVALSSADPVEELRRVEAAFRALPTVSEVDSALRSLPDDQHEKLAMIGHFAPLVRPLTVAPPRPLDRGPPPRGARVAPRRLAILASEPRTVRRSHARTACTSRHSAPS